MLRSAVQIREAALTLLQRKFCISSFRDIGPESVYLLCPFFIVEFIYDYIEAKNFIF